MCSWRSCNPRSRQMCRQGGPGARGYGSRDRRTHGVKATTQPVWSNAVTRPMVRHHRLGTLGIKPTQSNPCVYTHGSNDTLAILTLYVNDTLLIAGDADVWKKLKTGLMDRSTMIDMGEIRRILGMIVTRDYEKGTLAIDQKDSALNTPERFGMLDSNPVHTPGYGLELSQNNRRRSCWAQRTYQDLSGHRGKLSLLNTGQPLGHVLRSQSAQKGMQQTREGTHECSQTRTSLLDGKCRTTHHLREGTIPSAHLHGRVVRG